MKFWKALLAIVLMAGVSGVIIEDVSAARGSKSSPSRSSTPKSSSKPSSKPSGWNTRKPSSSSRPTTTAPKRSTADQKAYDKAKSSGTAFKSKSAATTDFKAKHASTYKSTYTAKPETRPSHIPESTSVGGVSHNVTYNQQYGGYGHMGPSGSWMMYDAMTDAVMLSALMSQNNYYVDTMPTARPVVVRRGPSGFTVFLIVCFGLIAVVAVVVIFNKSSA